MARRMRGFGSLGWSMALGLLLPVLASTGCGRRAYPAREPVSFAHSDGSVEVGGVFNQCPDLTVSVTPGDGPPGTPFSLQGTTSDADGDGVTVSLQSDSGGSFSVTNQLPSVFTCSKPGLTTITAVASDGSCQTMKSVSIFCLGAHDGGSTGPGVDAGRDGGASADGGDGGGTTVVMNTCPTEPTSGPDGGAACNDCTTNNCSLAPSPNGTDGCCGLSSAADQLLCIAAVNCFSKNNCTIGGDPNKCFCGTTGSTCYTVPGAAKGPCVAEVFAAAKKTDVTMVKPLFTSPASPLGRAVNLLGCRGGLCTAECGLP